MDQHRPQAFPTRNEVIAIVLALAFHACGSSDTVSQRLPAGSGGHGSADSSAFSPFSSDPFLLQDLAAAAATKAQAIQRQGVTPEPNTLWALSQADGRPTIKLKLLRRMLAAPGALPEILVPSVRLSIQTDPKVLALLSSGGLGAVLSSLFLGDADLTLKIHEGIAEKVNRKLGGPALAPDLLWKFDAYTDAATTSGVPNRFSVRQQTARWNFVLGVNDSWNSTTSPPPGATDRGTILLAALQVFSDWNHAFGITSGQDGVPIGGLLVPVQSPDPKKMLAIDRHSTTPQEVTLTGSYSVQYTSGSLLSMAMTPTDRWSHADQPIELSEQAMLWRSMAHAFARLRPDRRQGMTPFFEATGGPIPNDIHMLPLSLLPGMSRLLKDSFIDIENRKVRGQSLTGTGTGQASLLAISRLGQAISAWQAALTNLDQAQVPANVAQQLEEAAAEFQRLLQLLTLNFLSAVRPNTGGVGYQLDNINSNDQAHDPSVLATTAEVLTTLMRLEQNDLPSSFLRERLIGCVHGFAQAFMPLLVGEGQAPTSMADLVWTQQLLVTYLKYEEANDSSTWAQNFLKYLELVLDKVEAGAIL